METHIVIGAGYGDEGKGKFTDFFSDDKTLNIRFNGGAQAGHTVEKASGERHVFHHFGSGTFKGAHTFLDKHFVVSPELFLFEYENLKNKIEQVYIHPDCLVTTPYDVLINKFFEIVRGSNKHGSCGIGFGETIERSQKEEFKITFKDLYDQKGLSAKLEHIRNNYVDERLEFVGANRKKFMETISFNERQMFSDFHKTFLFPVQRMLSILDLCEPYSPTFFKKYKKIVFEGAQGLMLDQDYGVFPHVTRSNTGLKNVIETLKEFGINDNIFVHYITRIYTTRHGAGPLKNECASLPYIDFRDPTNVPNTFQDSIRIAPIDTEVLSLAIEHDLKYISDEFKFLVDICISCVDQFSASPKMRETLLGKIAACIPLRNARNGYWCSLEASSQRTSFNFFDRQKTT